MLSMLFCILAETKYSECSWHQKPIARIVWSNVDKFCKHLLMTLIRVRWWTRTWYLFGFAIKWLPALSPLGPFCTAVDWKAWKLFDYPDVIKTPMDLGTIQVCLCSRTVSMHHQKNEQKYYCCGAQKNLEAGKYKDALEFAHHVRLVWSNCKTYNQVCYPAWRM